MMAEPVLNRGGGPVSRRGALVLGSSGFIGSAVLDRLRRSGRTVAGLSSQTCNLLDPAQAADALERLEPESTVVFTAAIRRTVEDTAAALMKQTVMAANVVKGLPRDRGHALIFLSSVDVYGRPPASIPLSERSPVRPSTWYGAAKAVSELLLDLLGPDVPVTVLRLPGVYGPGDRGASVVGAIVSRILAHERVVLSGKGAMLRDYVHIDDVARLIERCIDGPARQTFNVATGKSTAVLDLVRIAAAALECDPSIEHRPNEPVFDLTFDPSRLRRVHGGVGFRSLETGVAQYAAAVRAKAGDAHT